MAPHPNPITPELLRAVGASAEHAALYAPLLDAARIVEGDPVASITSRSGVAMLVAQLAHESGRFQRVEESLDYAADRLVQVFGAHRITPAQAARVGRTARWPADPEAIANIVYGGAWGAKNLGNTEPGDGWRFRGRGLIQITGRANYAAWGATCGLSAEEATVRILTPAGSVAAALWYWRARGLLGPASRGDVEACTRLINGGVVGLDERWMLYQVARHAL